MSLAVCFLGTYEANYERNQILISGLEQNGVTVHQCHVPVWEKIRYKTIGFNNPFRWLLLLYRVVFAYLQLIWSYLRLAEHDVVIIGYLGHLDAILLSSLCRLRGKKVVFDVFISLYDTLVDDRKVVPDNSLASRVLRWIDSVSCRMADLVLLDTDEHINFFIENYGLNRSKFRRIFAGADNKKFFSKNKPSDDILGEVFTVFHYSKFAPLHGLNVILDAAKLLESEMNIRFLIVGGGQIKKEVDAQVKALALRNLKQVDWMEPEQLVEQIEKAGACLGIFGSTDKANRVIPNKVFQYMAVGGAIITRDSAGVRELLTDEENVLLCEPSSSHSLANAIKVLRDNPSLRSRIMMNARELFEKRCTPFVLGEELTCHLTKLTQRGC